MSVKVIETKEYLRLKKIESDLSEIFAAKVHKDPYRSYYDITGYITMGEFYDEVTKKLNEDCIELWDKLETVKAEKSLLKKELKNVPKWIRAIFCKK